MKVEFNYKGQENEFEIHSKNAVGDIVPVKEDALLNLMSNIEIALKAGRFKDMKASKEFYLKIFDNFLFLTFEVEYEIRSDNDYEVRKSVILNTEDEVNLWYDKLGCTEEFTSVVTSTFIQAQMGILGKDLLKPVHVQVTNTRKKKPTNVH